MKKNNTNKVNPVKNNYFVSIISKDENGKLNYSDIVYTAKNRQDCASFAVNNYTRFVTTGINTYDELVKLGVESSKLINFKNPAIY